MDMGILYMYSIRRAELVYIGRHIRYLRRTRDRTQEELADMLNVSVGWVSRIERGVTKPNLSFIFGVGEVLRVPNDELLPPKRRFARRKHEPYSRNRRYGRGGQGSD